MLQIPVKQASAELDQLLDKAGHGQELVIIAADGFAFKVMPLPRIPQPIFGSARGLVEIGPDFDDPIEGFEAYMPENPIDCENEG
jgi:antitoxin (DNA-binding transcriptional repressor) of toxin-antitoxin stability system